MFKYAFVLGITAEWIFGPAVVSLIGLGMASLRSLMYMLLAWAILEGLRAVHSYVHTFDDRLRQKNGRN